MTHRYVVPMGDDVHRELVTAELRDAGALGLWERTHEIVAYFDERAELDLQAAAGGRWELEPDRDWLAEWKAGLEPVTVGRITVAPSWVVQRPDEDTIILDPGMAFGTGHHATTRRCLAALERVDLEDRSVLDVGTGSGVLAIAAVRLGARHVVAVDVQEDAVTTARDNAHRNDVTIDVRHGSVGDAGPGPFSVVVANIATDVIVDLLERIVAVCSETLILSGIPSERTAVVTTALGDLAASVDRVDEEDSWVAITASAPASGQTGP